MTSRKVGGDGYSEVSITINNGSASLWGILVHNWGLFLKKHQSEVYSGVDFQGNVPLGNYLSILLFFKVHINQHKVRRPISRSSFITLKETYADFRAQRVLMFGKVSPAFSNS